LFISNSPPMPFLWTDTNGGIMPAQYGHESWHHRIACGIRVQELG
jgi:hypothetical protein